MKLNDQINVMRNLTLKAEVQAAQLRLMLSASKVSLAMSVLLASILAYMQYDLITLPVIFFWFFLVVLVAASRLAQIIYYQRHPVIDYLYTQERLRKFRFGVLSAGVVWGSAGVLMFPAADQTHQMFLILMLIGMSAGGLISFSADLLSAILYSISILTPIILHLFVRGDRLSLAMGMVGVLYLGFMILFLRLLNRNISESIEMRLLAVDREAEIRASDERYNLLLNNSPVGVFYYDMNLVITNCNDLIVKVLKSSVKNIIGLDMHTLKDRSFLGAANNALQDRIGLYEGKYHTTYSGDDLWISMICSPSRDSQGKVIGGIGIVQDFTERKASTEEINNLAYFDYLTGLPNRRLLLDRLKQILTSSGRTGFSGALMFIDLDNFKNINDTFGHDIGDSILIKVANRLVSCVRENDTVAHLSGDEFVVILELLSENPVEAATQTEVVATKIRAAINKHYEISLYKHYISPSIGITMFNGANNEIEELMMQSDIAMYQAKQAGRNTVRFFDPEVQKKLNARTVLESELYHAYEQNEFQLYFQVQIDHTQRLLGAEVLIRWLHPERGLVSPAQFIPLAEESGLIISIGQWVLEAACHQIKAWQREELTRDLVLAVNISAKQFRQADFVDKVKSALNHQMINPRLLKLELTESLLLDNVEDVISTMNELKEIGILFSLDDFGTGYSSLQYLKKLPLHQLKIDQSFVRDIATNSSDKAIVSTIMRWLTVCIWMSSQRA